MKKSSIVVVCLLLLGVFCARPVAQTDSGKPSQSSAATSGGSSRASGPEFSNDKEKLSYALGMRLALELKILRKSVQIDPDLVAQGLRDSLLGVKTRISDDERITILTQLQRDLEAKEEEVKGQMAETNRKEGEAFLEANKTKEGVVTLPSGLQYKVLTQGTGPKPTLADTVVCNYRGTFLNGEEFDSSYKRGQPSSFRVGGVIPGWMQALQLMPVGSKWQVFVPSSLAYGEAGHRPNIQPNSTLIFEVELLSIQPKENVPAK